MYKIFFSLAVISSLPFCYGCVIDPMPLYAPEKSEGQPNTFKIPHMLFFLYSKADKDIIHGVSIEHRSEQIKVWEIKAVRDIAVSEFKVTVGEVPKGFKQIVPKSPKRFVPTVGEQYTIYIHTKFSDDPEYSPHIGAYTWIADPVKSD